MAPSFTNLNGTTNARGEFNQLQRHHPYYINGGDIHFLVENYVFRVHRYFFERESTYFRDKLTVPATPGRAPQGTEDANAIVLDVRAQDFEKLMWVFYNPKYSIYEADVPTWATILQLAHRWWFPEVKSLCVRELELKEMSPVDRIVLYQKYEVDENLLVSRFAAVCAREEPITVDEGEMLGIKTAMRLTQARERLRSSDGSKSPLPPHRNDQDVRDIVISLFEIITPESLQTPATAVATEAAVAPPTPSQPAQQAAAAPPSTTTPAQTATTTTPSTNDTLSTTEPAKGPTPKPSMTPLKANTKPDHKTNPSVSVPNSDPKLSSEPPVKGSGEAQAPPAPAKDTNGSTNGSAPDLMDVRSPMNSNPNNNLRSPRPEGSVGAALSSFFNKGHGHTDSVDGTADGAGTDAETDSVNGQGIKKGNRKKANKNFGGLI